MENISKALLIAAGMLLTILIISLLVVAYNQISDYYAQQHNLVTADQLQELNEKFENYNRKNLRGTELISLLNRVIDYNERQSYNEELNFKRIGVEIDFRSEEVLNSLKYPLKKEIIVSEHLENSLIVTCNNNWTLTNKLGKTTTSENRIDDKYLISFTTTLEKLKTDPDYSKLKLTDNKLQRLTSNISNIFYDKNGTDERKAQDEQKMNQVITNILGNEINIEDNLKDIKNATLKYYQYTQLKRACFECIGTKYDPETGRIIEMNFKVQTDSNGNIVQD